MIPIKPHCANNSGNICFNIMLKYSSTILFGLSLCLFKHKFWDIFSKIFFFGYAGSEYCGALVIVLWYCGLEYCGTLVRVLAPLCVSLSGKCHFGEERPYV